MEIFADNSQVWSDEMVALSHRVVSFVDSIVPSLRNMSRLEMLVLTQLLTRSLADEIEFQWNAIQNDKR